MNDRLTRKPGFGARTVAMSPPSRRPLASRLRSNPDARLIPGDTPVQCVDFPDRGSFPADDTAAARLSFCTERPATPVSLQWGAITAWPVVGAGPIQGAFLPRRAAL